MTLTSLRNAIRLFFNLSILCIGLSFIAYSTIQKIFIPVVLSGFLLLISFIISYVRAGTLPKLIDTLTFENIAFRIGSSGLVTLYAVILAGIKSDYFFVSIKELQSTVFAICLCFFILAILLIGYLKVANKYFGKYSFIIFALVLGFLSFLNIEIDIRGLIVFLGKYLLILEFFFAAPIPYALDLLLFKDFKKVSTKSNQ